MIKHLQKNKLLSYCLAIIFVSSIIASFIQTSFNKVEIELRELKTDNNLLLLKTEMNAGHGGKSGRDGAIEEIALDYSFILKITDKI